MYSQTTDKSLVELLVHLKRQLLYGNRNEHITLGVSGEEMENKNRQTVNHG